MFYLLILYPHIGDPTDTQALIQDVADKRGGFWEVDHLLLTIGVWALMIGIVGVYRSITTGGAAAWARLGFYGALVGTTLWTVYFAIQGLALPAAVEKWEVATGSAQATLFHIAASLDSLAVSLFSMTIIAYWLALVRLPQSADQIARTRNKVSRG